MSLSVIIQSSKCWQGYVGNSKINSAKKLPLVAIEHGTSFVQLWYLSD